MFDGLGQFFVIAIATEIHTGQMRLDKHLRDLA